MDVVSLVSGGIISLFAYVLFTQEQEIEDDGLEEMDEEVEVNDFSSRYVTLSCQSCRKLKKHKEIQPDLFQCVKCKRHVDLRKAS
jgi:acetyl-CoA carboxylase beta subunit